MNEIVSLASDLRGPLALVGRVIGWLIEHPTVAFLIIAGLILNALAGWLRPLAWVVTSGWRSIGKARHTLRPHTRKHPKLTLLVVSWLLGLTYWYLFGTDGQWLVFAYWPVVPILVWVLTRPLARRYLRKTRRWAAPRVRDASRTAQTWAQQARRAR